MKNRKLLPVFRLNICPVPGELIPLHIFEPRYQKLVRYCIIRTRSGRDGEFAIVAAGGDELPGIGCTVRISRILNRFHDGRAIILVVGVQPCELIREYREGAFPSGELVLTDEDSDELIESALQRRVLDEYAALLQAGEKGRPLQPPRQTTLSYYIAAALKLAQSDRLLLLQTRSENARLQALYHLLCYRRSVRGIPLPDVEQTSRFVQ